MKLRSQISLFLLLLGLTPLLVAVAINVPLILDRLELFYHEAYLEKLRASFSDLDQHISRRQEMVRLFEQRVKPLVVSYSTHYPLTVRNLDQSINVKR